MERLDNISVTEACVTTLATNHTLQNNKTLNESMERLDDISVTEAYVLFFVVFF